MMAFAIDRPDTAFAKDRPSRQRQPRSKAGSHLRWIRTLPSVISGKRGCIAAHIRFADPRFAKRGVGVAEKPDDSWCLPLTPDEHTDGADAQHKSGEQAWWAKHGIDATAVAAALWRVSGDDESAELILRETREQAIP